MIYLISSLLVFATICFVAGKLAEKSQNKNA